MKRRLCSTKRIGLQLYLPIDCFYIVVLLAITFGVLQKKNILYYLQPSNDDAYYNDIFQEKS